MRKRVTRRPIKNRVYLFSGLMRCGECGGCLGGRTETNGGVKFYNCPIRYNRHGACGNNKNISEKKVERYLLDTVESKMAALRFEVERLKENQTEKDYSTEIHLLKSKISKLKDLYLNDLISLDEYKADRQTMSEKIAELEKQQEPKKIPDLSVLDSVLVAGWKQLYVELSSEKKREFWRIIIREIRFYPDRHIEYDLTT